jgi:hypothetical protein
VKESTNNPHDHMMVEFHSTQTLALPERRLFKPMIRWPGIVAIMALSYIYAG